MMQQPTKPDYKEVPLVEAPTEAHDWPGHLDDVMVPGEPEEARPGNPATGVITNITAHTDAE